MRDKTRLPTWKEIETSTNLYFLRRFGGGGRKGETDTLILLRQCDCRLLSLLFFFFQVVYGTKEVFFSSEGSPFLF